MFGFVFAVEFFGLCLYAFIRFIIQVLMVAVWLAVQIIRGVLWLTMFLIERHRAKKAALLPSTDPTVDALLEPTTWSPQGEDPPPQEGWRYGY